MKFAPTPIQRPWIFQLTSLHEWVNIKVVPHRPCAIQQAKKKAGCQARLLFFLHLAD